MRANGQEEREKSEPDRGQRKNGSNTRSLDTSYSWKLHLGLPIFLYFFAALLKCFLCITHLFNCYTFGAF